jgi:hypothetical protein
MVLSNFPFTFRKSVRFRAMVQTGSLWAEMGHGYYLPYNPALRREIIRRYVFLWLTYPDPSWPSGRARLGNLAPFGTCREMVLIFSPTAICALGEGPQRMREFNLKIVYPRDVDPR